MRKRILLPVLCLVLAAMLPLNALGAGSGRRVTLSQPEDLLRSDDPVAEIDHGHTVNTGVIVVFREILFVPEQQIL